MPGCRFLINKEVGFNFQLLRHYRVEIDLRGVLQPGFRDLLLAVKRDPDQHRDVEEAAKRLSIGRHASRLAALYERVIAGRRQLGIPRWLSLPHKVPLLGPRLGHLKRNIEGLHQTIDWQRQSAQEQRRRRQNERDFRMRQNRERHSELDALRQQSQNELDALRQQSQNELDALRQQSQNELDAVRQQSRSELDAVRQQSQSELDAVLQQRQNELDAVRQQSQSELDAVLQQRQNNSMACGANSMPCANKVSANSTPCAYNREESSALCGGTATASSMLFFYTTQTFRPRPSARRSATIWCPAS